MKQNNEELSFIAAPPVGIPKTPRQESTPYWRFSDWDWRKRDVKYLGSYIDTKCGIYPRYYDVYGTPFVGKSTPSMLLRWGDNENIYLNPVTVSGWSHAVALWEAEYGKWECVVKYRRTKL